MTPVVDGIFHQFERDAIVFCPLLTLKVGRRTCELKLALEQVKLVIIDVDLRR